MSDIKDFVIKDGVLTKYKGKGGNVVIPDGVKNIENNSFAGCEKLTNIKLPDTLNYIGSAAFSRCTNLVAIDFPESVLSIGIRAFGGCNKLRSVKFHKGIKTIGERAFEDCKIENITLPEYGSKFEKTTLEVIWNYFLGTDFNLLLLASFLIQLPELVSKNADIKKKIKAAKNKLIDFAIASDTPEILENLFGLYARPISIDDLDKYIQCAVASAGIKTFLLDYKQQKYSSKLQEEHKNDKIEKALGLKERTIAEWKKIFSFSIGDEGITIKGYKGKDTDIVIPGFIGNHKVVAIGKSAFNPEAIGSVKELKLAREKITSIVIPEGVTSIEYGAFKNCEKLTSVEIPDSVKTFGKDVFYNCKSLVSLKLPDGITIISYNLCCHCEKLTSITIPEGVTSIGNGAFSCCDSLTAVTIPDSVTTIGEEAFCGCESLTTINIPNSVRNIGPAAFNYCKKLTIHKSSESSADEHDETCCPLCGGEMQIHAGRYGEFLGCERYPLCKGTRKLNKPKN